MVIQEKFEIRNPKDRIITCPFSNCMQAPDWRISRASEYLSADKYLQKAQNINKQVSGQCNARNEKFSKVAYTLHWMTCTFVELRRNHPRLQLSGAFRYSKNCSIRENVMIFLLHSTHNSNLHSWLDPIQT